MYKSKLQELCHEKKWGLPKYTPMKDGADHNPCFRACVTLNGLSFDSPVACKSSKQAQNQAAMVAFRHFTSPPSSSPVDDHYILENPEATNTTSKVAVNDGLDVADMFVSLSDEFPDDGPGRLYKNLLQELAQREGFSMPVYRTVKSGASHMPTFSSTVEVKGEKFCGHVGKSKKQAELIAAKTAYTALNERAFKTIQIGNERWKTNPEQDLISSLTTENEECTRNIKGNDEQESENMSDIMSLKNVCNSPDVVLLEMGNTSSCLESVISLTEGCPSSPEFKHNDLLAISSADENVGKIKGLKSYLLCNRFRIYTESPDIAFPKCITVLPISEDKWVAVRLEFPNEKAIRNKNGIW